MPTGKATGHPQMIAYTIIFMPTATPQQPQGCTNLQLRQLMRRVAQHYDSELAQAGLKTTQYSLLSVALALGPSRPADLAAALKIDASTLTRNLKPLVAAGWLRMEPGLDGRSRSVVLTPQGLAKRTEAKQRWKAAQLRLNATLGEARVVALHALIQDSMSLLSQSETVAAA
jgi:DNA-binding MarR family transcriptional regulator